MTARQSNLSQPQYAYDLVVATTQDSINATMKEFLDKFEGQEFVQCYTWDTESESYVLANYDEIRRKLGKDPFDVEADDKTSLEKLDDLKFEFAFKAKMGLPDPEKFSITQIPDIVTLDKGSTIVTYHLCFAEFEIIALEEHHHKMSWIHLAQESTPWVFRFNVNLDMRSEDFDKLDKAVKDKVRNLCPESAFSVQQLYLDLNTVSLQDSPKIEYLDTSSNAYDYLNRVFVNTYWKTLQKEKGDVLLGYTIKPAQPDLTKPSIIPTDLTIEIAPHRDEQGKPTGQYGLYTLNYLVMAKNHPFPRMTAPFAWNWMEANETTDYHGAMAIKRNIFIEFLADLVNQEVSKLCIEPKVSLTHSGEDFKISYNFTRSPNPARFEIQAGTLPQADGFTKVLTLAFSRNSQDDSTTDSHATSIHGEFNYSLSGNVWFKDNLIHLTLRAVAYCKFNHREVFVNYTDLDGNYLDITATVKYELGVTPDGQLLVTPIYVPPTDASKAFDFKGKGILGINALDDVKKCLNNINNNLKTSVVSSFQQYQNHLTDFINHSHAWVYPGGKTFTFKKVFFSDALDLITYIQYVEPS